MDMTEIQRFEQQTKKLKLSEAIRIGAKLRPQCYTIPFAAGGSCALGAAAEGLGMTYDENLWSSDVISFIGARMDVDMHIIDSIWSRNDSGEPREQIADWLETQGY